MHESRLARQLLDLALLQASPGDHIQALEATIVDRERMNPDSIRLLFEASARGTAAEGALLDVECRPLAARCCECGSKVSLEEHVQPCEQCGSLDCEPLEPETIRLAEVTLTSA